MAYRTPILSAGLAAALALSAPAATADRTDRSRVYERTAGFASGLVRMQAQTGASLIARTFSNALLRSRNSAHEGSRPVPDEVKQALAPFFPSDLLGKVRYKVGDVTPDGLAGFAIRNGDAAAVTLVDTIVFREERFVTNIALWAHEMHHIEQYAEWGVEGFAERYAFGWRDVEQAARDRADEFLRWRKEK